VETTIPAKLLWRCRRGMKELDLMLIPFVENCYTQLSLPEQGIFVDLLAEPDPVLYAWLLGYLEPQTEFIELIEKIKNYGHDQSATYN
jgi:antitoxin CptB